MWAGGAEDDGMAAEERPSPMAIATMETIDMISGMGREPIIGATDASSVVGSMVTSEREKAHTHGQTVLPTRVSLRMDNTTAMVSTNLPMDRRTQENGKRDSIMVRVPASGVTVEFSLAIGTWAKHMDKERKSTLMARFATKDCGRMIDPFVSRDKISHFIIFLPRQMPDESRSNGESWSMLCVIVNSINFVSTVVQSTRTYGYEDIIPPAVLLVHYFGL